MAEEQPPENETPNTPPVNEKPEEPLHPRQPRKVAVPPLRENSTTSRVTEIRAVPDKPKRPGPLKPGPGRPRKDAPPPALSEYLIHELDAVAVETLHGLRYVKKEYPGKYTAKGILVNRMVKRDMDPNRARAIGDLLRFRKELYEQYGVGDKLAEQQAQLEVFAAEVERLKAKLARRA